MGRLALKVTPKASRSALTGWAGDTLRVAVTAAPDKGKANAAVIALLAEALGLAKSRLHIVRGETQAHKLVEVEGLSDAELQARLGRPG
jgi:uncharacterized protein (TIGR00251 family)